jgi:hypothetical protein
MDRFWDSRVLLVATVVATFAVFGLVDGTLPQTPAAERLSATVHVVILAFLVFGWARTDLRGRGLELSGGRTAAIVLLGLAYVPFHVFRFRERGERWRPVLIGLLGLVACVVVYTVGFAVTGPELP